MMDTHFYCLNYRDTLYERRDCSVKRASRDLGIAVRGSSCRKTTSDSTLYFTNFGFLPLLNDSPCL